MTVTLPVMRLSSITAVWILETFASLFADRPPRKSTTVPSDIMTAADVRTFSESKDSSRSRLSAPFCAAFPEKTKKPTRLKLSA